MRAAPALARFALLGSAIAILATLGCGNSVDGRRPATDAEASMPPADAEPIRRSDGGVPPGSVASSCSSGQFATGFDEQGRLRCEVIDTIAKAAINQHCALFMGWRDSCDACASAPSKWGSASGDACANGAGADNTCAAVTLGGAVVQLFGLNTDGDVNGDDKFYVGFRCAEMPIDPSSAGAQCTSQAFLSAVNNGGIECTDGPALAMNYARQGCSIYLGWRDSCDGCTTEPSKVGRVNSLDCTNQVGADSTCISSTLDGSPLPLFGLNTDGDVNGDDKFYVGLACDGASESYESVEESCSPGHLVTAVLADGSLECSSPALANQAALSEGCYVYYGWQDQCEGCTTPPTKWGRTSNDACENGLGANNSCKSYELAGVQVNMFGLNTDGDVNGDDTFYSGFLCQ